jgi:Flp pilus assembly protein TadG
MRRLPHHRRPGAAAVEFSVVCLVFFTLILGVVELARGFMVNYALIQAARQGCRAAVPSGKTNADVTPVVTETLNAARLQGATVTVLVNGTQADAGTAKSNDRVTVSVAIPAENITWVPGARYLSGNLTGQYTLRRE